MESDIILKTTTIRVPKETLNSIKVYCRKKGQPIGEWAQTAWRFIEKNDFDIYDLSVTPFLPVPPEVEKERGQVETLCQLMKDFIITQSKQNQLPPPDTIAKETAEALASVTAEKGKAEGRAETLAAQLNQAKEEINSLRAELETLRAYKERAHAELCRIKGEQRYFGKTEINTDL